MDEHKDVCTHNIVKTLIWKLFSTKKRDILLGGLKDFLLRMVTIELQLTKMRENDY